MLTDLDVIASLRHEASIANEEDTNVMKFLCNLAFHDITYPCKSNSFPGTQVTSLHQKHLTLLQGLSRRHIPYKPEEIVAWLCPVDRPIPPFNFEDKIRNQPSIETSHKPFQSNKKNLGTQSLHFHKKATTVMAESTGGDRDHHETRDSRVTLQDQAAAAETPKSTTIKTASAEQRVPIHWQCIASGLSMEPRVQFCKRVLKLKHRIDYKFDDIDFGGDKGTFNVCKGFCYDINNILF